MEVWPWRVHCLQPLSYALPLCFLVIIKWWLSSLRTPHHNALPRHRPWCIRAKWKHDPNKSSFQLIFPVTVAESWLTWHVSCSATTRFTPSLQRDYFDGLWTCWDSILSFLKAQCLAQCLTHSRHWALTRVPACVVTCSLPGPGWGLYTIDLQIPISQASRDMFMSPFFILKK